MAERFPEIEYSEDQDVLRWRVKDSGGDFAEYYRYSTTIYIEVTQLTLATALRQVRHRFRDEADEADFNALALKYPWHYIINGHGKIESYQRIKVIGDEEEAHRELRVSFSEGDPEDERTIAAGCIWVSKPDWETRLPAGADSYVTLRPETIKELWERVRLGEITRIRIGLEVSGVYAAHRYVPDQDLYLLSDRSSGMVDAEAVLAVLSCEVAASQPILSLEENDKEDEAPVSSSTMSELGRSCQWELATIRRRLTALCVILVIVALAALGR